MAQPVPAKLPPPDPSSPLVIYILGGPGVGKGTQCQRLASDLGLTHFSVGDLLRASQTRPNSPIAAITSQHLQHGRIVPADIALPLIQQTMAASTRRIFLIDGFPRSMEQAMAFEREVCASAFTLFFDCPPGVMLQRVLNRGRTSGRIDDNEEAFWRRWNGYLDDTLPVLEYLRGKGEVVEIDCSGPLDDGYEGIKRIVEERIAQHHTASGLIPKMVECSRN